MPAGEPEQLSAALNRSIINTKKKPKKSRSMLQKTIDSKRRLEQIMSRRKKYGLHQEEKSVWSDSYGILRGVLCISVMTLIIFSAYLMFYERRLKYPALSGRPERHRQNLYNSGNERFQSDSYLDRFDRTRGRSFDGDRNMMSWWQNRGRNPRQFGLGPPRRFKQRRGANHGRSPIPRTFQNNRIWNRDELWQNRYNRNSGQGRSQRGASDSQAIKNYLRQFVNNRGEANVLPEFDVHPSRGLLQNLVRNPSLYASQETLPTATLANKDSQKYLLSSPQNALPLESRSSSVVPVKAQIMQNNWKQPASRLNSQLYYDKPVVVNVPLHEGTKANNELKPEEVSNNRIMNSVGSGSQGLLGENLVQKSSTVSNEWQGRNPYSNAQKDSQLVPPDVSAII